MTSPDEPPRTAEVASFAELSRRPTDHEQLPYPEFNSTVWTTERFSSKSTTDKLLDALTTILMVLSIAFFILLAIFSFIIDDRPAPDRHGEQVKSASLLCPTLFPIAFTASVGRAMKQIASWRLEKGTRVGTLEAIMGSTGIFGALQTQFMLRDFRFLGLVLIVVWCFSPLGGQSGLRAVNLVESPLKTTSELLYMNTSFPAFEGASETTRSRGTVSSAYVTTVAMWGRNTGAFTDAWGNVKVPFPGEIEAAAASGVPLGNESYVSLAGIPIGGLPESGENKLTIRVRYLQVGCQPYDVGPLAGAGFCPMANSTFCINGTRGSNGGRDVIQISNRNPNPWAINRTAAECHGEIHYLDVDVHCVGRRECQAVGVRDITGNGQFNTTLTAHRLFQPHMFSVMSETGPRSRNGWYGITEEFLVGRPPFSTNGDQAAFFQTPVHLFSKRLGISLTTFWWLGIEPTGVGYARSPFHDTIPASWRPLYWDPGPLPHDIAVAQVVNTISSQTYKVEMKWAILLIFSSSVALVVLLLGAIVDGLRGGPQVLGYVSSLTRDIPLPLGGAALDGAERTRAVKGLKVKLGDVWESKQVGHIAVAGETVAGPIVPQRKFL